MPILVQPRDLAELTEIDPALPPGAGERFSGYGVAGLPFSTGHILALRRYPATSAGRSYASVWHRDPGGRWTFWSDRDPEHSCARYYAGTEARVARAPIRIRWTGARAFHVQVGERAINWVVTLRATPATWCLNTLAPSLADSGDRPSALLQSMGRLAGALLGAGRLRLAGRTPNGPRFRIRADRSWMVESSRAIVGGESLGEPGRLPVQAALGDFLVPQRGVFVVGMVTYGA